MRITSFYEFIKTGDEKRKREKRGSRKRKKSANWKDKERERDLKIEKKCERKKEVMKGNREREIM